MRDVRLESRHLIIAATIAWVLLLALSFFVLVRYSLAPGKSGKPPSTWPVGTQLSKQPGRQMLVLAIHPRCPCSRATIAQLAQVITSCQGRMIAEVLFVRPPGFHDPWVKTDLWQTAQAIPGVETLIDDDGIEARRFGAFTSGQVALYNEHGILAFSGGITGARGHIGTNLGHRSVIEAVNTGQPSVHETSVYGCPLEDPKGSTQEKEHHLCRSS